MKDPALRLIFAALAKDDVAATGSWQQWRTTADILTAPWQQLQLLPIIPRARLQSWLIDDAEADRLNGIVRRAWTESQIQLAPVLDAAASIDSAGCAIALFGSASIHLRMSPLGSIYPLNALRLLVSRTDLGPSAEALRATGWRLNDAMPAADAFNGQTHIGLSRDHSFIHLHWRVLDVPPDMAVACEREFSSALQPAQARGSLFRILSPGHELLATLAGQHASKSETHLPWQLEAGLLANQVEHWRPWARLASKFNPSALASIDELRAFGIAIPPLPAPRPHSILLKSLTHAIRWRGRRVRRRLRGLLYPTGGSE